MRFMRTAFGSGLGSASKVAPQKQPNLLNKICQEIGPDSERQTLARQLFDEEYSFNAGKFIVLSWLFKGKAEWSDRDWEEALSTGALTVHLAAPTSLEEARRKLRQRLNTRKLESLEDAR
jgi:hypothetical protein